MKIIYTFFISILLLFTGCTTDTEVFPEDSGQNSENLMGTWYIKSIVRNGKEHLLSSCEKAAKLLLQEDTTFRMQDKMQLDENCISTPTEGTWSATPTELSMTVLGDFGDIEVYRNAYELKNDALRIYKSTSESENSENNDIYVYTR